MAVPQQPRRKSHNRCDIPQELPNDVRTGRANLGSRSDDGEEGSEAIQKTKNLAKVQLSPGGAVEGARRGAVPVAKGRW